MVQAIPAAYAAVTPYLIVRDAGRMLDFYKQAFGAIEVLRLPAPGGRIGHAEIKIGEGMVMLADESPERGHKSPLTVGGAPVGLMFYVADVNTQFPRAIAAGATVKEPLKDQFYGDRSGTLVDPSGHVWTIATHTEDVSPDEMSRRIKAMMAE